MIRMTNATTKRYLVTKTALEIFGSDFDDRAKKMSETEAEARFDMAWKATIEPVVSNADECDIDLVREHVKGQGANYIRDEAKHRHFKLNNKFFIAQLVSADECDQLWLVPSAIRDPWTVYVKFAEVRVKEQFEEEATKLGWRPEQLGEKLLADFMESTLHARVKRRYESDPT
jgi:hypothetical protein